MANPRPFEFRVLRYAPNPFQEVAANIGVVLVEVDAAGDGFADFRLTQDWRMVRVLDPHFDFEYFVEFEKRLRAQLNSSALICSSGGAEMSERDWILHVLDDGFSNGILVSTPKAVMAEDPVAELGRLVKQHCELVRTGDPSAPRTLTGRTYIKWRIAEEFQLAGLSDFVRADIEASQYTAKGDRLKIDFGYVVTADVEQRRDMRLFQAVSLKSNPDAAKVLAFSWPRLRDGILRAGHAHTELTAVVEDDLDRNDEAVNFAMATMLDHNLIVRNVSETPAIAAQARRDLRI